MRHQLQLHPDFACDAVTGIDVDVARTPTGLMLHYIVSGTVANILLPGLEPPRRGRQLWEHSCFEVFIRPGAGEAYFEYNVAPSREWAAYRFAGHRSGMEDLAEAVTPGTQQAAGADCYAIRVGLDLNDVPELARDDLWHVNVSVVIEEATGGGGEGGEGRKSYWALAHPPGKADFHHPDCFILQLPPAA
jgi:hypothetical protein